MNRSVSRRNLKKIVIAVTIACCLFLTYLMVGTFINGVTSNAHTHVFHVRTLSLGSRTEQNETYQTQRSIVVEPKESAMYLTLADIDKRYHYGIYTRAVTFMMMLFALLLILSQVLNSRRVERRRNRSQQAISIVMEYIHKVDGEWGTALLCHSF